jgi:hypothetical protein
MSEYSNNYNTDTSKRGSTGSVLVCQYISFFAGCGAISRRSLVLLSYVNVLLPLTLELPDDLKKRQMRSVSSDAQIPCLIFVSPVTLLLSVQNHARRHPLPTRLQQVLPRG